MTTYTIGQYTVEPLLDGAIIARFSQFLPGADEPTFSRLGGIVEGNVTMPLTTYLIRGGGRTIAVDTGVGAELPEAYRAGFKGEVGKLTTASPRSMFRRRMSTPSCSRTSTSTTSAGTP